MSSGVKTTREAGADVDGEVEWLQAPDSSETELHRLALRDGCSCPACRHPIGGQRLYESRDVVTGSRVDSAASVDGALHITWADGHESIYDGPRLTAATRRRPRRAETLWGAELAESIRGEGYADIVESRAARRRLLGAVSKHGFARIVAARIEDGAVVEVAELFA